MRLMFVLVMESLKVNDAKEEYDCYNNEGICITGFDKSRSKIENNVIKYTYSDEERVTLNCHVNRNTFLSNCRINSNTTIFIRWKIGQRRGTETNSVNLTKDIDLPLDTNNTVYTCHIFDELYGCGKYMSIVFVNVPKEQTKNETHNETNNSTYNENLNEANNETNNSTHNETYKENLNEINNETRNETNNGTLNVMHNETRNVAHNETRHEMHNETHITAENETHNDTYIDNKEENKRNTVNEENALSESKYWIYIIGVGGILLIMTIMIATHMIAKRKRRRLTKTLDKCRRNLRASKQDLGNDEYRENITSTDSNEYDYCSILPTSNSTQPSQPPISIGDYINLSDVPSKHQRANDTESPYSNTPLYCNNIHFKGN